MKTAADSGKLFGSVTPGDVVIAIKKAGGPNLDKRTVRLPKGHIKSVGSHPVTLHLHPDVDAAGCTRRGRGGLSRNIPNPGGARPAATGALSYVPANLRASTKG